ncbi:MAG: phosphate acyltransferase PlsX [Alphaproteobacteria bacterium]
MRADGDAGGREIIVRTLTAALDVMGGDSGAEVVLPGAEYAAERMPDLRFLLFGDEAIVGPLLDRHPALRAKSEFEHCDVSVQMDDKPSQALRRGRYKSSMWRTIEAVKEGRAAVAISAGNTGALMAMSKFCLRDARGIDRPAIAAIWPTIRGETVVLDVGATIGAHADQLFQYAVMGAAMSRALFDNKRPTVGLLNIGVEEVKGLEAVRGANQLLREADLPYLDYHGFVEGNDIGKGTVDVVVTEGFAGNIALKTAEGTVRQIIAYFRAAAGRDPISQLGFLLAGGTLRRLKNRLDTRRMNGGVFLGLNGLVIKSHGGTDAEGFASAIGIGVGMARVEIVEKINQDLSSYRQAQAEPAESVTGTGAA